MKKVTNLRGIELAQFARINNISSEEFDIKKLQEVVLSFKKVDWVEKLKQEASKIGAQIHIIYNVEVDYGISHNEIAMKAGPQTKANYNVLKVADQYLQLQVKVIKPIILVNFPKGGQNYTKVVEWGIENGLTKSIPHDVFAVVEQNPSLNNVLNMNNMYIVETTGCMLKGRPRVCSVWFYGSERQSFLGWQGSFGGSGDWFTFSKELDS